MQVDHHNPCKCSYTLTIFPVGDYASASLNAKFRSVAARSANALKEHAKMTFSFAGMVWFYDLGATLKRCSSCLDGVAKLQSILDVARSKFTIQKV